MKKLLPAALMLSLLTGCGANHLVSASSATSAALAAQSKANVEKNIHAMFRAAFVTADANQDGRLSLAELPTNLPMPTVPGSDAQPTAAGDPDAARAAMMNELDVNKDGAVTFREFSRQDAQQAAIVFFRSECARIFTGLDKNGDHALVAGELQGSPYAMDDLDLNQNGKITESEFEDGLVKKVGGGPDPVPAPAVDPNQPAPAPAADTPADAPTGDAS